MIKTVVCEIEKYATHDGPGIRTVVFLKGCPLRCLWCSNPETQRKENELFYNINQCILCGCCVNVCKYNALKMREDGLVINRENCVSCGACVDKCPTSSIRLVGSVMTLEEVFNEVEKDTIFYTQSGGGITVSGGEVLMNSEFVTELLKKCKENYINTAVETSGFGDFKKLKDISQHTDLFMFDIKHSDAETHKKLTGVANTIILQNLQELSSLGKNIIVRVPLMPGLNDTKENIINTAKIAKNYGINELHLLPYHSLGVEKYRRLQKEYLLKDLRKNEQANIEELKGLVESLGVKCVIGG